MTKKDDKHKSEIDEIMNDLQRMRADFENYRKRMENEKVAARESGKSEAVLKLLPVIDDIERALSHQPKELADNPWVKSVSGLMKQLDKSLEALDVRRIDTSDNADFNPDFHEAIQFDEDSEGDKEVIAEALQTGYTRNGAVLRPAMVKVRRTNTLEKTNQK